MRIMKFGGASVKDSPSVRNTGDIIRRELERQRPILVVVSAMDKTTNQLEILAWRARDAQEAAAWEQLASIRNFHEQIAAELFPVQPEGLVAALAQYFGEIERIVRGILLLNEFPDRTYDRIVAYGELISSTILYHYLAHMGLAPQFLDVRQIIRTDATYKQANVVWSLTRENIQQQVRPALLQHGLLVTQGFIATSMEGKVTTLGREGSDFTAAIFAHCLEAESLTVWKDVPGVLTGDPRLDPNVRKHETLSYDEAAEMTYFGATVIHPKTIRPLYMSHIPLRVRSFKPGMEADAGTLISATNPAGVHSLPTRILKKNQVWMRIRSRDFSFMESPQLVQVLGHAEFAGLAINLMQTSAITLMLCVNDEPEALHAFSSRVHDLYEVTQSGGWLLTTVLHPEPADVARAEGAPWMQFDGQQLFSLRRQD